MANERNRGSKRARSTRERLMPRGRKKEESKPRGARRRRRRNNARRER